MDFIQGEESLFYIKKNNSWVPVACLTANPLSEQSETIKTTTRDNDGWTTIYPTLQSYSIEITGNVVKDDIDSGNNVISYRELRNYKRNRVLIDWQIKTLNGWYVDYGKAYITSISVTDTAGEDITFTATLTGYGKPLEGTDKVYLLGERENVLYGDDSNTVIKTE